MFMEEKIIKDETKLNEEASNKENVEVDNAENEEQIDEVVEEKEEKNNIEQLKEKIQSLESEIEDYNNRFQRLQADFINYRKRVDREQARIRLHTISEIITEILPVIDNFERALNSADGSNDEFKKGVEMIYRQLVKVLEKEGVEVIPTVGEVFDHNRHEALMQVEEDKKESGIILEELQKGYILDGKVIRPAMVKVAL